MLDGLNDESERKYFNEVLILFLCMLLKLHIKKAKQILFQTFMSRADSFTPFKLLRRSFYFLESLLTSDDLVFYVNCRRL